MKIQTTPLMGALVIEPDVFEDQRGFFMESFQKLKYKSIGVVANFVQDNISSSNYGTIRGLHYQYPQGQSKLVQVLAGEVFDVAVDIRLGSPSFGKWYGIHLSGENKRQFFIPKGFAHGFCVLSENAIVQYKCDDYYAPQCECGILWNDPQIAIGWPKVDSVVLSEKDKAYPVLKNIHYERLPLYDDAEYFDAEDFALGHTEK
ncbi:MAG: dTDP-4-dehydrorhamnose 3,5-epimerase [Desulfobacteraceae bacterium]|jgi:dTDP-4-dehydrorhamnose 3,5-epimerase